MPNTAKEMMHIFGDDTHRAWIAEASDEQLDEYISLMPPSNGLHEAARAEREKRHFKHVSKPHWTLTPSFWILIATLAVTILVLIVSLLAWLFPREPAKPILPIAEPTTANPSISPYTAMPQTNAASPPPVLTSASTELRRATNATQSTNHHAP